MIANAATWHVAARCKSGTALLPLTEITVPAAGSKLPVLLTAAGLTSSNSEANRKIREHAVRTDAQVIEDLQRVFVPGFEGVLQVGKRNFARGACVAWIEPDGEMKTGRGRDAPCCSSPRFAVDQR